MKLQSLDPRINRLGIEEQATEFNNSSLDQGETYEAFVQVKEGKPYEHVGIIHATNESMAMLFAKEQYSRRGNTCTGLWVVKTQHIQVSEYIDNNQNIYDKLQQNITSYQNSNPFESYEVFHLKKRGKQHIHAGTVQATQYEDAFQQATFTLNDKTPLLNVWIIRSADIFRTSSTDGDIWDTLPEKKYREAMAYKAGDKLKKFKENNLNK